jgi:hypothetical protein
MHASVCACVHAFCMLYAYMNARVYVCTTPLAYFGFFLLDVCVLLTKIQYTILAVYISPGYIVPPIMRPNGYQQSVSNLREHDYIHDE